MTPPPPVSAASSAGLSTKMSEPRICPETMPTIFQSLSAPRIFRRDGVADAQIGLVLHEVGVDHDRVLIARLQPAALRDRRVTNLLSHGSPTTSIP